MLFLLRFILTTLWLLFVSLLFPELQLGNRFLILAEAFVIVYTSSLIRRFFSYRLLSWKRGFVNGLSAFIVLFLWRRFFTGINLNITGLIMAYAGISVFEILFPKQEKNLARDKSG